MSTGENNLTVIDYNQVLKELVEPDCEVCTCKDTCSPDCKGECGCAKCHQDYNDFLSLEP